ncbi:hypothetical protein Cadr_000005130 [Camelus dromedarius]|uniref:Uncharacterized protein n=1 Tax=Camelus dromedarius TaxID=9838 RepID=A0A5N4E105_CAMDR|nr:hypothetical protein Cadr_000005130 [Camelus dromedarius]
MQDKPEVLAFQTPPKASSDVFVIRNPTMGTHASTQPMSSATSTLFPRGCAAHPTCQRCDQGWAQHLGGTAQDLPARAQFRRFGVSAVCKGGRSQVGDFELCRLLQLFASQRGEVEPEHRPHAAVGGRGPEQPGPCSPEHPHAATGPSTKQQPGFGGTAAPI